MLHTQTYLSPLGAIKVEATSLLITRIYFTETPNQEANPNQLTSDCCTQLAEYFEGKRQTFSLPLDKTKGTEFQQTVWNALQNISFSTTTQYGLLAQQINKPKAQQAVGQACKNNPWVIVVPCHRVVSRSKNVSGYAYGVWRKVELNKLEARLSSLH